MTAQACGRYMLTVALQYTLRLIVAPCSPQACQILIVFLRQLQTYCRGEYYEKKAEIELEQSPSMHGPRAE